MSSIPIKKIRIAITDIGPHADKLTSAVLAFVDDLYDIEITTDYDADFVFHSCLGYDVLKYTGVRIYITEENVSANLNFSDYALDFDAYAFSDRHIWLPLIKLYNEAYAAFLKPRPGVEDTVRSKPDFCCYVMSSTRDSAHERIEIYELLSRYKKVNSGGKWNNNVGGPVSNKQSFQATHKFAIAFENMSAPGYLTEKFSEAAAVNAIPIYWGDPTVAQYFNPKAFINCHDFPSLEAAVEYVKKVDQDDTLYRQMLAEPWFHDGTEPECLRDAYFRNFLINIFNQDPKAAYRRNRGRWGIKQEKILNRMYNKPLSHGIRQLRTKWLNLYHKIVPRREYQG